MDCTSNETTANKADSGPTGPLKDTPEAATLTEDRIIRAPERRQLVPYSDMHIWRLEKAELFPKRIKLGPQSVGWSLREVREWIEERKADRFTESHISPAQRSTSDTGEATSKDQRQLLGPCDG